MTPRCALTCPRCGDELERDAAYGPCPNCAAELNANATRAHAVRLERVAAAIADGWAWDAEDGHWRPEGVLP